MLDNPDKRFRLPARKLYKQIHKLLIYKPREYIRKAWHTAFLYHFTAFSRITHISFNLIYVFNKLFFAIFRHEIKLRLNPALSGIKCRHSIAAHLKHRYSGYAVVGELELSDI